MKSSLVWGFLVLGGCVPYAEEVVIAAGDGAIVFGQSAFITVLGGRDELAVLQAFNGDGSILSIPNASSFNLGEVYCVRQGFDSSKLNILVARIDNVPNDNEPCTATSGLPCRAQCDASSPTWRVSRR